MRFLLRLVLAGLCIAFPAWAGSDGSPQPDKPDFGSYGYKHLNLHEHGIVQKMIDAFGTTCCDSGNGGECRVTEVRYRNGQMQAWLDGTWCPLSVQPRFDISLPPGVNTVVCASKYINQFTGCPARDYCAATSAGT